MDYRPLGRTGVKVSPLCLGCMMFGGRTDDAGSARIIDHAISSGINFLDTANVYSRGLSEEAVGKALAANGKRDRVVLATKVFGKMDDSDPNAMHSHRRHIVEQCELSLKRLKTDRIDLYQIHRPISSIPIDETLRALDDLIRAGKILYVGTSTFAAWQLMEALMVAREIGTNRFICEQPPYNLLDRRIERELIPFARTWGVALIPWSPLGGGFLTGKYKRGDKAPEGSRLSDLTRHGMPYRDEHFAIPEALTAIGEEHGGATASQIALSWCMNQPGITSPIVGPRTLDQFKDNLGALTITLTDADRARLDAVAPPGRVSMPFYEADFGPHLHRV